MQLFVQLLDSVLRGLTGLSNSSFCLYAPCIVGSEGSLELIGQLSKLLQLQRRHFLVNAPPLLDQ